MKKFSLVLSVVLTVIVFSFSFASGEASGSLSLEISNFILDIITDLFPNNQIEIADLHIVVRKSAHVFEYLVLGLSWFFTGKLWNMSYLRILFIGLLIAIADEAIQNYAIDRGPSVIDALVYDFIPFIISSLIALLIHNRKGKTEMSTNTLNMLQENRISPRKAYNQLYKKQRKPIRFTNKAHFIKIRVIVPDDKSATRLLRWLLILPIPIFLIKFFMLFVKEESFDDKHIPLSKKEIMKIISSKGININVKADSGERVLVKTI